MENWNKHIQEATEKDMSLIEDAIGLPTDALPFDDIFSGKRRLAFQWWSKDIIALDIFTWSKFGKKVFISKNKTEKPNGRIEVDSQAMIRMQESNLKFDPKTKKLYPQLMGKEFEISLEKFLINIKKMLESSESILSRLGSMQQTKLANLTNKYCSYFSDELYVNLLSDFDNDSAKLLRFLINKYDRMISLEDVDEALEVYGRIRTDLISPSASWMTDKYTLILSRDPIDVFRMSDHKGLENCHSLPSVKGGLDRYNVCAAAEAHGNGAVAYLVEMEDFKDFFGSLDPNVLDDFEGEEIFSDPDRGVYGVTPASRIRIRKVGLDSVEYGVVEKKVYGEKASGLRDKVHGIIKGLQGAKFETLKSKQDKVDLSKGERFGGSYQDNIITDLFAEMLSEFGISASEHLRYSNDLEETLLTKGHEEWKLILELQNKEHDHKSDGISFKAFLSGGEARVDCLISSEFSIISDRIEKLILKNAIEKEKLMDFFSTYDEDYVFWEDFSSGVNYDELVGYKESRERDTEVDATFDPKYDEVTIRVVVGFGFNHQQENIADFVKKSKELAYNIQNYEADDDQILEALKNAVGVGGDGEIFEIDDAIDELKDNVSIGYDLTAEDDTTIKCELSLNYQFPDQLRSSGWSKARYNDEGKIEDKLAEMVKMILLAADKEASEEYITVTKVMSRVGEEAGVKEDVHIELEVDTSTISKKDIGRVAAILNKIPEQEDKIFQYAIKMYSVLDSVVSESRKYKLKIIKG